MVCIFFVLTIQRGIRWDAQNFYFFLNSSFLENISPTITAVLWIDTDPEINPTDGKLQNDNMNDRNWNYKLDNR